MNGTSVRPACIVIGILMVILASPGFAPSARGQAPAPGASSSPVPAPDVPTLPTKPGQGGLTIALLMLALFGATAVAAELSELKQRREAERVHPREPNLRDAHAEASTGSPPPCCPEGIPLEPR